MIIHVVASCETTDLPPLITQVLEEDSKKWFAPFEKACISKTGFIVLQESRELEIGFTY